MYASRVLLSFLLGIPLAVCFISIPGSSILPSFNKFKMDSKTKLSSFDPFKALDVIPQSLLKDIDGSESVRRKFETILRNAQKSICSSLEKVDGTGKFREDAWTREDGGGGISCVLSDGKVFEKAGVNLAVVYGSISEEAINTASVDRVKGTKPGEKVPFFACGLSSVIHPRNPHCPTMHFNYRYFETAGGTWWFGGGTDITPSYLDESDVKHFHHTLKTTCDKHDANFYPKFKKWADEYFYIKHRGETRGLGGIFYDDLNDRDPEKLMAFAKDNLEAVPSAYVPIVEKHKNDPFTEKEKEWQQLRRGRYVEFNIIYDRGTIFGLKAGGRIESILMSLPLTARWEYDHHPLPNSKEEEILKLFQKPKDWV